MDERDGGSFPTNEKLIANLQTLTTPIEGEELIIYLAATKEVVSAVLMAERGANKCQFTL